MDYSETLIAIQQAKDKCAQACREKDWQEARRMALYIEGSARDLFEAIRNEQYAKER